MKIVFVGGGNMASALIGGLLAGGGGAGGITVIEPLATQRADLERRFGVATRESTGEGPLDADVVVLAVKPQQLRAVAAAIAPLAAGRLVVSVAAGIRLRDLSRWLGGHARLVRCMPNTPALIGAGVTGMVAYPGLSGDDRDRATKILASVGETVWFDEEALLDAVTAVSGSGPAYVFYFMEAVHRAAVGLGLTDDQARRLTSATFVGAARLAAGSDASPSTLRERVTSKGGTTAAALAVMAGRGVGEAVEEAIRAACRRSAELGDEFGAQ